MIDDFTAAPQTTAVNRLDCETEINMNVHMSMHERAHVHCSRFVTASKSIITETFLLSRCTLVSTLHLSIPFLSFPSAVSQIG